MTDYYKAVRPDGYSFHDPNFRWATEPGGVTKHPDYRVGTYAGGYLSVSTSPSDCTGLEWPCRLLVVEPVGEVFTPDRARLPNKRAGGAFRTIRELPAHEVFGPQGEHVAALIGRAARLTPDEASALGAAWVAARSTARVAAQQAAVDATWDAAREAAWDTTREAMWGAAWEVARAVAREREAAWEAARALVSRDLISTEHYDTLTRTWRTTVGSIHPDDPEMGS